MSERHGDAEVMRNSLMARSVLLNPTSATTRELAAERFRVWLKVYDYAAVLVADANGVVQMTEPADFPLIPEDVTGRIQRTLASQQPVQMDLHRDQQGQIRLWMSGQVYSELQTNSPPDGVFISVVDPYQFLYPFINKWPTPSKSAETLLVQRDGNYAVYQNPLSHATNAPLTFQIPIGPPTQLLCVKILRGDQDVAEGKVVETFDYRGVPVLAVARQIAGTPWVLVAKIDKDEVFAPLRREAFQIALISALLLLIIGLGIAALSRQQKLAFARANEARFRMLIEQAPTAISISRGNKTIYVNRKYLDIYGFKSLEEVADCPVTDQWAPEFRPLIAQRIRQRARGEPIPNEYEGVGLRRDGSSFPVHVAVTSVELSDGKASLAFLTDITERKRAEASSSKLAAIVESTNDAIISKTLDGIIASWNQGAEKLFGYSAQEAVGRSMLMVFPPERVEEERDILQRIARGETVENFETERLTKDGQRLQVSVTISPIRNAEGVITGASKIARDITEQKRVEESLKLFRLLIDHANDAIEVVDPQTGRFLDVNEKTGALHGCTREEYMALTIPEIDPEFAAAGEGAWSAHLAKLKRDGFLIFESSHHRKDGSVFPVEINASYVRLERDYILAVVRDITERKRTEMQIQQLNRVYAVLSGINTLIVRERNPQKLLEAACQIAVDKGRFRMAWVGLLEEATGRIWATASAGAVDNYLDNINIDLADPVRSAGPSGQAFLTGKHHFSNDVENDPAMLPWRADALRLGYHSSGAFPLKVAGKVIGMFSLYASEKGFFDSQELQLLDELAGDISFGLEVNRRELERQRVEGLFTMAFERAAIGKALVAPDGRWLKVNHALRQMLGYSEAEFYAKSFQDFTHPDDRARDAVVLEQLLAGGKDTFSVEKRYRHQSGHYVWAYLTTSLVRNEAGDPDYFISQIQDLSERRHLEDATQAGAENGSLRPVGRRRGPRLQQHSGRYHDASGGILADGRPAWNDRG